MTRPCWWTARPSTGADTLSGIGRVLVVSTTDPDHPTLLSEVDIPGTVQVMGIAKEGNLALVLGSSGGRENGDFAWTGHLVLATLDLTDPRNPQLIATQDLSQASSNGESGLLSLGNGMFASRISGTATQTSALMLINAKDPHNLVVSQIQVPTDVIPVAVAGNLLYTTGPSGVLIFDLGAVVGTPVTAQVTVPKNSYVSSSFNLPPTKIISGSDSDTLEWDLYLTPGNESQTLTWQSAVTGLQPGESRPVTQGATVTYVNQGTHGDSDPATAGSGRSADPRPRSGLSDRAAWSTRILQADRGQPDRVGRHLQPVAPGRAPKLGESPLLGHGPGRRRDRPHADVHVGCLCRDGRLWVRDHGQRQHRRHGLGEWNPDPRRSTGAPDPEAHGVVVSLSPTQASAGQGTPANYVVQVTNTGSADDTFTLTATGLPSGVAATFGQTTIDVPPGASNFRDVTSDLDVQGRGRLPATSRSR